jgi:hypothetical protein
VPTSVPTETIVDSAVAAVPEPVQSVTHSASADLEVVVASPAPTDPALAASDAGAEPDPTSPSLVAVTGVAETVAAVVTPSEMPTSVAQPVKPVFQAVTTLADDGGVVDAATRPADADVQTAAHPVAEAVKLLEPALSDVAQPVGQLAAPPGPTIGNVTEPVGQAVEPLGPVLGSVVQPLGPTLSVVTQPVGQVVQPLAPALGAGAQLVQPVTHSTGSLLEPIEQPLADIVNPVVAPVAHVVDQVVEPVVAVLVPVAQPVGQLLGPVIDPVGEVLAPVTAPVAEALSPVTEPVVQVVSSVVDPVAQVLSPITQPVAEVLAPVAQPVVDVLSPVAEPVVQALSPVTVPVLQILAPVAGPVTQGVSPVTSVLAPVLQPIVGPPDSAQLPETPTAEPGTQTSVSASEPRQPALDAILPAEHAVVGAVNTAAAEPTAVSRADTPELVAPQSDKAPTDTLSAQPSEPVPSSKNLGYDQSSRENRPEMASGPALNGSQAGTPDLGVSLLQTSTRSLSAQAVSSTTPLFPEALSPSEGSTPPLSTTAAAETADPVDQQPDIFSGSGPRAVWPVDAALSSSALSVSYPTAGDLAPALTGPTDALLMLGNHAPGLTWQASPVSSITPLNSSTERENASSSSPPVPPVTFTGGTASSSGGLAGGGSSTAAAALTGGADPLVTTRSALRRGDALLPASNIPETVTPPR